MSQSLTIEQAIQEIEWNRGRYAKDAVHTLVANREEAIPQLKELISCSPENVEKIKENLEYFGHIYALFILSELRAKEAFPAVVDFLKQSEENADYLFGDAVTEAGARWLASTFNGDFELLKSLVEAEDVDVYSRTQGLLAMANLVLWDELDRDAVVEYCKDLLARAKEMVILADIAYVAGVLGMGELKEQLKAAYAQGRIDKKVLPLNEILPALSCDPKIPMDANKEEAHCRFIDSVDEELGVWPCFELDYKERHNMVTVTNEHKVGRNDPCTCGSGKKYKKCCGK